MPHATAAASDGLPTLYDVPVSNNGARVRLILYWKDMEHLVSVKNPSELGGLKSETYLALNPQGKMPLLVMTPDEDALPHGLALPESEVIAQFLLEKYSQIGPELIPGDLHQHALAMLATRVHDLYIAPVQGCMYRGPMGVAKRAEDIATIAKQMDAVEKIFADAKRLRLNAHTETDHDDDDTTDGQFICGPEPCFADAALFPTWIFMERILPTYFGWDGVFEKRPLTEKWFLAMAADTCGARVLGEIRGGLDDWHGAGRWETTGVNDAVMNTEYKWKY